MPEAFAIVTVLFAGGSSAALIAHMLSSGRVGVLDEPNGRSLHATPVPRSGGAGIVFAAAIGLATSAAPIWLVLPIALLAAVSWFDDQHQIGVALRFACHLAAAALVVCGVNLPHVGLGLSALAVFGVVWMTNLYNFMDGADGLAGGMSVIGFAALALAAHGAGDPSLALLAACIAAGAAGFLAFNFPPARIFMGDIGSIPLGFLAASLSLIGMQRGLWPLSFPLLVFAPFVADASVTLLRRALRSEAVWRAHREHYYQRLVQSGWSHLRLVQGEYALMAATSMSALLLRAATPFWQWSGIAVWVAVITLVMVAIDRRWHRLGEQDKE